MFLKYSGIAQAAILVLNRWVTLSEIYMPGKKDKLIAFTAAGIMAALVLIQHVRNSCDVIAAPVFSLFSGTWASK